MRLTSALVSLALASFAFAPAALAVDTTIRGVDYDAERGVIVVHGAGGLRILTTRLDHPNRLVIDFPGSHFARTFQSLDGIPGTGIVRVRVGQYQSTITRVVLDMSQFSEFKPVSVGQDVLIPVRANADTRAETPVAAAPSPEPEPAAVPEAPEMPTISAIRYRQGRIEVQMDRRAPYWSHVSKGSPTVYSLHFPHVRLSRALDGSSHTINSFGIFRWEAHQDGDTARIDIPMSKTPDFRIDAGVTSWTFASDMPVPVAARPAPRHDEPDAPATPRWAKTTEAPLTLKRVGDQWFMAIHADGRFRFRTTRVGDDRLHLDIAGARVALPRDSVYIDSGLIARVRTQPMGSTTRLTIDLDQAVRHTARMIGDGSTLLLTLSRVSKDQITVDPGHAAPTRGPSAPRARGKKASRWRSPPA